ncbi:MAG: substrate-binding domain-containing protein [Desulfatibacillaceae bacterium]
MKKSFVIAMVSAVCMLMAGTALAADYNINLYGASAQFLYWNDAADNFLTTASPEGPGCASADQATYDGKHGITRGNNCLGDGSTIYIRYTAKASYDGIFAVSDSSDPMAASCDSDNRKRMMVDESSCTTWDDAGCTELSCQYVTLGASDVSGTTFKQYSWGQDAGHLGGGAITRSFSGVPTTGLAYDRPVVVPFGFFVNSTALPTLDNLSRAMPVMIYSGQADYWDDFDSTLPNKKIVACLRHAGSGTHATLDAAIMRGDAALATMENPTGSGGAPVIWFNDGSSDMMRCIDQNGGFDTATHGAVGYADADYDLVGKGYTNVSAVDYMGVTPSQEAIQNCAHTFWSAQWIFWDQNWVDTNLTSQEATLITQLMSFASDGSNLPSTKATWWSAQDDMNCSKATDWSFPTRL